MSVGLYQGGFRSFAKLPFPADKPLEEIIKDTNELFKPIILDNCKRGLLTQIAVVPAEEVPYDFLIQDAVRFLENSVKKLFSRYQEKNEKYYVIYLRTYKPGSI